MSRKADAIDSDTFYSLFEQYSDVVNAGLEDLDEFRYKQLPQGDISRKKNKDGSFVGLKKADLERLVEWKLRHGTYRPSLAKLVASNNEKDVLSITSKAFTEYLNAADSDPENVQEPVKHAIKELTGLKGVGPATASLILSCFNPNEVPFFSDELYRWLHWDDEDAKAGSGWDRKIKYTAKEYASLLEKAGQVRERLSSETRLDCIEMEKAAYVLGKQEVDLDKETTGANGAATTTNSKPKSTSGKRKLPADPDVEIDGDSKSPEDSRANKRTRSNAKPSMQEDEVIAESESDDSAQTDTNKDENISPASEAFKKHIANWPKKTAKERRYMRPGTKTPKDNFDKDNALEEKAIMQGQDKPVLNKLGYVYNVKALKSGRTAPRRKGGNLDKMMKRMDRQDEEEKRIMKAMGYRGAKDKLSIFTKERWQDRVARDLDIPFHCVDPECYEEWRERGYRLKKGEYDEKYSQPDDDRIMFLATGSALLVGYYDDLEGKHLFPKK